MSNVVHMSDKISDLKHADTMLKQFVKIRATKEGVERALALVQWAEQVDAMYQSHKIN